MKLTVSYQTYNYDITKNDIRYLTDNNTSVSVYLWMYYISNLPSMIVFCLNFIKMEEAGHNYENY